MDETKSIEGMTRVVLRRFKMSGEVVALFPDMEDGLGLYMSYDHVGQHGAVSRQLTYSETTPARMAEPGTAELVRELTAIGYKLRVVQRMTRKRGRNVTMGV